VVGFVIVFKKLFFAPVCEATAFFFAIMTMFFHKFNFNYDFYFKTEIAVQIGHEIWGKIKRECVRKVGKENSCGMRLIVLLYLLPQGASEFLSVEINLCFSLQSYHPEETVVEVLKKINHLSSCDFYKVIAAVAICIPRNQNLP
jgi:hypothetical protein